jgi:hypothetical protein
LKLRKVPAESLSLSADIELGRLRVSREGAGGASRSEREAPSEHAGMHVCAPVQTRIVSRTE